jgi:GT2 family glycosyltransferase
MIKVSITILSYNRKDDLRETITNVLKSKLNGIILEIIVSDNASNDGTVTMIENEFPNIILIKSDKNEGVKGYNAAFNIASGKYILILDDDSFPEINSIQRMVEEFEKDDKTGIIAFDVRNYYDYKDISENISSSLMGKNKPKYLMGFNGAGAGFRKSLFDKIGGYPEEFFLYWNEMDLAIRVLNSSYKIVEFSDIISFHKYAPSNRTSTRGPFYYTRNLYWIYWKYFPFQQSLFKTIRLIFYSILHSFEQNTFIYIKASLSAFLNIKKIKRYKIKKNILQKIRI